MPFRLELHCYNGMRVPLSAARDDERECRRKAASHIRYHYNEIGPVTIIERGRKWELETDEGAFMIGDHEGIMTLYEGSSEPTDELFCDHDEDGEDFLDDEPVLYRVTWFSAFQKPQHFINLTNDEAIDIVDDGNAQQYKTLITDMSDDEPDTPL